MDEFRMKLKESLLLLDERLRMVEHLVNDVIIDSLESAANEYADNEAFETFKGNYGESLKDLIDPYKVIFGEDYDLERSLYDDLKGTEGYGTEGFDEKGCMDARIADLRSRIDGLKATKAEDEEKKDEDEVAESKPVDKEEEEEVSEEQLAKELEDALKDGGL